MAVAFVLSIRGISLWAAAVPGMDYQTRTGVIAAAHQGALQGRWRCVSSLPPFLPPSTSSRLVYVAVAFVCRLEAYPCCLLLCCMDYQMRTRAITRLLSGCAAGFAGGTMMVPHTCTDESDTLRMFLRAQERSTGQPAINSVLLESEHLSDATLRKQAAMLF